MRQKIDLPALLALAVFSAACTTAGNSNSNTNTRVTASPSPSTSPANSKASMHDNMNAAERANMNMGNMNMGNRNKKANASKTP